MELHLIGSYSELIIVNLYSTIFYIITAFSHCSPIYCNHLYSNLCSYQVQSGRFFYFYIFLQPSQVCFPRGGLPRSLRYLLTAREQKAVVRAGRMYRDRFGKLATGDQDFILHLGDDPSKRLCWSATSKKVPTIRRSSGKYWHYPSKRWMTAREKLATLGFPVSPACALAMAVPILPVQDVKRAATLSGNCMVFGNILMVEMIALACCQKVP